MAFGSSEYVGASIGAFYKEPPPFDLQSTYEDSACKVPIVFVLTSGADPTQYLLALAKSQGYTQGDNLKMVSLGQGQGPIAERLMAEGTAKGNWVCLQNCHLCVSWMPTLDASRGASPDGTRTSAVATSSRPSLPRHCAAVVAQTHAGAAKGHEGQRRPLVHRL